MLDETDLFQRGGNAGGTWVRPELALKPRD
jgi:hypothetical protein